MRIEQLTFTRFLAAISIVIYHFGLNIFPFNSNSISFIFSQANVCVSYFFILSGFVMIIAYSKKSSISFPAYMKSRFARLYPIYILALVMFLWITKSFDLYKFILNVLLIQTWIPDKATSLNATGWALSVEMFFYLLFPILFNKIYSKKPFKKVAITVLIIFIVYQIIFQWLISTSFYKGTPPKNHNLLHYFPLMHFSTFLVGNIAGLFFIKNNKFKNYDLPILLCIGLIILSLKYRHELNYHNGLLAILFVPLIVLMSYNNGYITKIFSKKIFKFLGETSYCIYILQIPVFYLVRIVFYKWAHIYNASIIFYTHLFVLIVVAAICYKFIETPLRNVINKLKITASTPLNN